MAGAFVARTVLSGARSLLNGDPGTCGTCGTMYGRGASWCTRLGVRLNVPLPSGHLQLLSAEALNTHHAGNVQALLLAQRACCCSEQLPCSRCVATKPQPPTRD